MQDTSNTVTLVCSGKVAVSTGIGLTIKVGGPGGGGPTVSLLNATSPPDPFDAYLHISQFLNGLGEAHRPPGVVAPAVPDRRGDATHHRPPPIVVTEDPFSSGLPSSSPHPAGGGLDGRPPPVYTGSHSSSSQPAGEIPVRRPPPVHSSSMMAHSPGVEVEATRGAEGRSGGGGVSPSSSGGTGSGLLDAAVVFEGSGPPPSGLTHSAEVRPGTPSFGHWAHWDDVVWGAGGAVLVMGMVLYLRQKQQQQPPDSFSLQTQGL